VSPEPLFDAAASRRLEAVYQTPDVVAQRHATLKALALQPGERVLDVGCGPGLLAAEMAQVVGPGGHVVGLEISPNMLAVARSHSPAGGRISLVQGDATALPFADGAFDAVTSTQVFEYLAEVATAAAEVARVLRPGGRVLLLDTDWDSIIWHADDQPRMQRVLAAWTERFADARLPRTLGQRLRAAGLQVRRREVLVLFNPDYDPETYSVTNGEIMAEYVTGRNGISGDDAKAWRHELQRLGEQGRYFFSLNRYLFIAVKPSRGDERRDRGL
jgi:arsenite methyltransferase